MKTHWTRKEFHKATIAQDDDNDYEESGWVALVLGPDAALARYSHCSCYGTFTSLCGGGINNDIEEGEVTWEWMGSVNDLVMLAAGRRDPIFPQREVVESDRDGDHLLKCYDQVLIWAKANWTPPTPLARKMLEDGREVAMMALCDHLSGVAE